MIDLGTLTDVNVQRKDVNEGHRATDLNYIQGIVLTDHNSPRLEHRETWGTQQSL